MTNNKYIGAFHSIDTVLSKITELETEGHSRNGIFAISKEDLSMLREEAGIEIMDVTKSRLLDRDEEQTLVLFGNLGVSEQQARVYYEDIKGGSIALFVRDSVKNHYPDAIRRSDAMDSSVERGPSGQVLNAQAEQEQVHNNELTIPRINTTNL